MTRRCFFFKHTPIPIFILLLSLLTLMACARKAEQKTLALAFKEEAKPSATTYRSDEEDVVAYNEGPEDKAAASGLVAFTPPVIAKDVSSAAIQKKIIKNGEVRYSVRDYHEAGKAMNAIVARYNGYITEENESRSDLSWEIKVSIKVPAQKFDSCLEALAGTANTLIEKNVSATDVTEEYIDVASRMKAKKEVELRYLEILKQAKTVEGILKVEEQLKSIREEIEASQGRLQYIDHNVAMSTISLSFYQTFATSSPQGPGFFSRIFFSIKDGWNDLLSFVVGIVQLWPGIAVVVVIVLLVTRYIKRRKSRKMVSVA
ncbi:DUF4349 domain-containing protein [Chitinophaga pinensis]|uniref:DUF4349 domain-containing protein n=1 Tax=Chitinophaga pinensis (strain ATCC 43595 / DSM 2588 / LMG 13176 / NBRC 15968 / NCIMB 11800 / UQM 2034) TaxID=485918 RepID=A0A979G8H2_CHIPD|nr:DUF4349 domain-containing protein [Chitinophaga pinensis]ACU62879.1 hypothetical protein Cpin_5450 [Chitinophaga pinensis DSM 2588]